MGKFHPGLCGTGFKEICQTLISDSDIMSANLKDGEFKHDHVHNGHSCQIR